MSARTSARRLAALVVAALMGLPLAGVLPAEARPGAEPVAGLEGFYAMVAGPARVFVSDPVGGRVAALRPDGTLARTLVDLPGASGMTVVDQTLYVAVSGGSRIEMFDISRLRPRGAGAIETGSFADPRDLAYAGGRLWFTAGPCEAAGGRLVSVALDGTGLTEYVPPAPVTWTACPRLNASEFAPDVLFVQGSGADPVELTAYDVSGPAPSLLASRGLGWDGAGSDVGVLPGGTGVVVASPTSGADHGLSQYAMPDLAGPSATFLADDVAGAAVDVTDAGGGLIAGGVDAPDADRVWVWRVGDTQAVTSFDLGASPLYARGLAFSPDGALLFAATQPGPGQVEVSALDPRGPAVLGLEASTPVVTFGSRVDLVATLGGGDTNRTVRIYGTSAGEARRLVVEEEVDADGRLAVSVRPRANTTFVATYDGDASTSPARSAEVLVRVRPRATGRTVDADGRSGRFAIYDFSARCPSVPSTCPLFEVSTRPDLTGSTFHYLLQARVAGSWRTALEGDAQLGPGSAVVVYFSFPDRSAIGTPFRARAELPAGGGLAAARTGWSYFELRSGSAG